MYLSNLNKQINIAVLVLVFLSSGLVWSFGEDIAGKTGGTIHGEANIDPSELPKHIAKARSVVLPYMHHKDLWRLVYELQNRYSTRMFLDKQVLPLLEAKGIMPEGITKKMPSHVLFQLLSYSHGELGLINEYLADKVPSLEVEEDKVMEKRAKLAKAIDNYFGIEGFGTEDFDKKVIDDLYADRKDPKERRKLRRRLETLDGRLRNFHTLDEILKSVEKITKKDPKFLEAIGKSLGKLEKVEGALQKKSQGISTQFLTLLERLISEGKIPKIDPMLPLYLSREGQESIHRIETYVNHEIEFQGKKAGKSNLLKMQKMYIRAARPGDVVSFSYFDFDLPELAEELVKAAKRGVKVYGVIDMNVVDHALSGEHIRPGVKKTMAVFEAYEASLSPEVLAKEPHLRNFFLRRARPVSLMHQKFLQIISYARGEAVTINLSGNPTRSGIHPDGDVRAVDGKKAEMSRANTNNAIVSHERGYLQPDGTYTFPYADYMFWEITLKRIFAFSRGTGRSLMGMLTNAVGGKQLIDTIGRGALEVATTPNGGMGNVGKNMIATAIAEMKGKIRIAAFANSSKDISEGIRENIRRQMDQALETLSDVEARKYRVDFAIIGEKGFAMMFWSELLSMAGIEKNSVLEVKAGMSALYRNSEVNEWRELLTDPKYQRLGNGQLWEDFRRQVFIAPKSMIGTFPVPEGFELVENPKGSITVKLHHKLIVAGILSTLGSSLNMSKAGEKNHEIIPITYHRAVAQYGEGIVEALIKETREMERLINEALRRNYFESKRAGRFTCGGALGGF